MTNEPRGGGGGGGGGGRGINNVRCDKFPRQQIH